MLDFLKAYLRSQGVIPAIVGLVAAILAWLFAKSGFGLPDDVIPLFVSLIEAALLAWAGNGVSITARARAVK